MQRSNGVRKAAMPDSSKCSALSLLPYDALLAVHLAQQGPPTTVAMQHSVQQLPLAALAQSCRPLAPNVRHIHFHGAGGCRPEVRAAGVGDARAEQVQRTQLDQGGEVREARVCHVAAVQVEVRKA